jgi:ABC-2 type transport system ATP-binding protein
MKIVLEDVSKNYKDVPALQGIHLEINSGEIFGLLGANGAGKSTTINLLLGMEAPNKGNVTVGGLDPFLHRSEVNRQTGYIPENVHLYPYLSGLENLDYFNRMAGIKMKNDEMEQTLLACGLDSVHFRKRTGSYSKGMRQKIAIAIAMAKNAKLYLLDEPASGLDPLASNELSELLKKLSEAGSTIVMASHDIFRVKETCHKIGILKKGELLAVIDSAAISPNDLERLYLNYMKN